MSDERAYEPEYIGFWSRVLASIVDTLAIGVSLAVILWPIFGTSMFVVDPTATGLSQSDILQTLISAAFVLGFWFFISSTPGKLILDAYIVDANTLAKPQPWQLIVRYLGYYVSIFTLGLGFIWVGIDRRKQGFHDKMARTVVIRGKPLEDHAAS